MGIGKQISRYRAKASWTLEELEQRSGVQGGTIHALEQRDSGRSKYFQDIARAFGLTVEQLADETRDYPVTPGGASTAIVEAAGSAVRQSKFQYVAVIGKGSGGMLPERIWTDGDQPVGASSEYAEVVSGDPHAFIVEVVGTSMVPRYNPGEYALVEPGTEPDIEDDVLVRLANGQTMIKRLLSRRAGLRLGSYNEPEVLTYKAEEVSWVYYVAYPVPARKIKSRV